jgi:penicillin amidase
MVRSYVEGVNAFLAHGESKLPVEFMLASITPRPWTCVEVLAAERLMGFQLSCGFQQKIIRGKLMSLVGPLNTAYFHHFDPDVPTSMSELNDEKVDMSEGLEQVFADIDAIWAINDPADGSGVPDVHNRGQGSNAWAISGTKTESGKPLLAGDPHLKLAQPHIWSVHHLLIPSAKKGKDDALNCFGVTLPGFPGIVMGRNQHMAYSITLSYVDVEDLFLEKVRTDDASYLYKDSWKPIKFVKEDIVVKGRAEVVPFTASYTHHGPILSDIIPKFVSGTGAPWPVDDQVLDDGKSGPYVLKISLASKTLLPVSKTTFAAYFMNRASNWKQFRAACGQMTTPLLNFVYADVHGDIGYSMPGDCPIREKKHSGLLPAPGWTGECEWLGSIPKAEMPYSLNPEQGFIVSCNHKATPEDYPYYMGALFWPGYVHWMSECVCVS